MKQGHETKRNRTMTSSQAPLLSLLCASRLLFTCRHLGGQWSCVFILFSIHLHPHLCWQAVIQKDVGAVDLHIKHGRCALLWLGCLKEKMTTLDPTGNLFLRSIFEWVKKLCDLLDDIRLSLCILNSGEHMCFEQISDDEGSSVWHVFGMM